MIVVVLGMHRSGTSLVSSILHAMGVRMGEPAHLKLFHRRDQPQGYWEDQDFTLLNRQIIKDAGGDWYTPLPSGRIVEAAKAYREEMAQLIERKEEAAIQSIGWGWKDPRNCLTMGAWWPFVSTRDLRIVRVRRSNEAIVDSLIRRGTKLAGGKRIAWTQIIDYNWKCTMGFLRATDPTLKRCADVRYEDLVNKDTAIIPLNCMAAILGLEGDAYIEAMSAAMDTIKFRED